MKTLKDRFFLNFVFPVLAGTLDSKSNLIRRITAEVGWWCVDKFRGGFDPSDLDKILAVRLGYRRKSIVNTSDGYIREYVKGNYIIKMTVHILDK